MGIKININEIAVTLMAPHNKMIVNNEIILDN